jgi:HEXXH motif-containing protein
VLAIEADDLGAAERLLREIAAAPNVGDGPRIVDLRDPADDSAAERYVRLVDMDPDAVVAISPPGAASGRLRALIAEAVSLIDAGNPALGAEIRAIVREIVLAHGAEDAKGLKFDGVSSFMLWGGVVLNVDGYSTAVELVQALAHESGHNLLFGLCVNGPLQDNDDNERYSSPLRRDLRPMDGIVHATYVTARMHQSIQRLLDADLLGEQQRQEAEQANALNARHFASGMETVDRHARLTALGQTVMNGARDYMRAYL